MKRRAWFTVGAAVAVLLVSGLAVLATRHSAFAAQATRKATYYCPMHPSYTSDHPGDCPICNMRLV